MNFSGNVAWRLYDTYGFPIDLTKLMCEEKRLKIDMDGYERAKNEAKLISKGTKAASENLITLDVHSISELMDKGMPITNDSPKYNYEAKEDADAEYCKFVFIVFIIRIPAIIRHKPSYFVGYMMAHHSS